MLLDTLGAILLGYMLAGKVIVNIGYGKGTVRAGYRNEMDFSCRFIR